MLSDRAAWLLYSRNHWITVSVIAGEQKFNPMFLKGKCCGQAADTATNDGDIAFGVMGHISRRGVLSRGVRGVLAPQGSWSRWGAHPAA